MKNNQGAISIARNPVTHSRTKHIDTQYHYIREAVGTNIIDLKTCMTEDMHDGRHYDQAISYSKIFQLVQQHDLLALL